MVAGSMKNVMVYPEVASKEPAAYAGMVKALIKPLVEQGYFFIGSIFPDKMHIEVFYNKKRIGDMGVNDKIEEVSGIKKTNRYLQFNLIKDDPALIEFLERNKWQQPQERIYRKYLGPVPMFIGKI